MGKLLDWVWRVLSLLGLVLSLRRWWRTLTDPEESKETRALAGAILLAMVVLLVWSLAQPLHRRAQPSHVALAAPAAPGATQLVVDLRDDLTAADVAAVNQAYGLNLHDNSPQVDTHLLMVADLPALSAARHDALLDRLRHDPRVEAADDNFTMTLLGEPAAFEPNDPRYAEQWNLKAIGMPEAWTKATGKGAVVAVIDTGVAFERYQDIPVASDLKQTRWTKPYDFTRKQAKAYDDHGHGTHVSGTIAQSTNNGHGVAGIAYDATIMPLKVLTGQGYGNLSDIADAIHYAADNGANVINMSLGGPRGSQILARACRYAYQRGVVIVCAAGNTGAEGVCFPAAYPECIAVAATGPAGELTFYSTWGKEIAIAAPGGEYRSPEDKANGILQNTVFQKKDVFEAWQGTSMASPHVAGVAALLVSQGITGPDAVRARLTQSAQPKDDPRKYGAGLLDAARAVGATAHATVAVDKVARPASHGWLWLLSCALWPWLATVVAWGLRPLRPVLLLAALASAGGSLCLGGAMPVWAASNVLAALGLAWLIGRPAR